MRLLTAHRILIGAFVLFSIYFGLIKLRGWREGGGTVDLAFALGSFAVAVGFALYLSRLQRPPSD